MAADRPRDPFSQVAQEFEARTGISADATTRAHFEEGIRRAMRAAGAADAQAFAESMRTDDRTLDLLVSALTVRETYFFRDDSHFELIRERILPAVRARRSRGGPGVQLWSAGCASGEEIYSVAILLAEEGMLEDARLLGTDISGEALEHARAAAYRPWALRGASSERAARWFHPARDRVTLDASIRDSVVFRTHNLATAPFGDGLPGIGNFDVILCRNVLIYFTPPIVAHVARGLRSSLADGGWLITGPSDPPLDGLAALTPELWREHVYYRATSDERVEPTSFPVATPPRRPRAATMDSAPSRRLAPGAAEVRALANRDLDEAVRVATEAVQRAPLSAELHHLLGLLQVQLDREEEAEVSLSRALYLDPSLAITHFLLGTLRRRRGDLRGAVVAYRRALEQAKRHPPNEALPLSDDEPAGQLAAAARAQLQSLGEESA